VGVRLFEFDNSIRVPKKWLTKHQVRRYNSNSLGRLHEPEEEKLFLDALASLPKGAAFLNLGAAWGYYSILAKKTRPDLDVFAVEAHPKMCSRIYEASAINGVAGISVINSAVVGCSELEGGPMKIKFGYGASIIGENVDGKGDFASVGLVDLGRLLEIVPNSEVMVTMDIQGSEEGVCRDLSERLGGRVSTLIVGTHGGHVHEICKEFILDSGFVIEFEDGSPLEQPDGILYATRNSLP